MNCVAGYSRPKYVQGRAVHGETALVKALFQHHFFDSEVPACDIIKKLFTRGSDSVVELEQQLNKARTVRSVYGAYRREWSDVLNAQD